MSAAGATKRARAGSGPECRWYRDQRPVIENRQWRDTKLTFRYLEQKRMFVTARGLFANATLTSARNGGKIILPLVG